MTEKFFISYHHSAKKIFLTGSFLSEIDAFQKAVLQAIYKKTDYDNLEKDEVVKERCITFIMTNCNGGVVSDMFSLLGFLRLVKKEMQNLSFELYCFGSIQSAATIFMCGEVFQRVIVDRNCEFRIHSVQTTFKGDSSFKKKRSEATAKSAEQTEEKMCEIYNNSATRRGKKETNWQHIIDNGDDEPSMNAKQFLDMGLCDEIL